jgi:hypothetical protein
MTRSSTRLAANDNENAPTTPTKKRGANEQRNNKGKARVVQSDDDEDAEDGNDVNGDAQSEGVVEMDDDKDADADGSGSPKGRKRARANTAGDATTAHASGEEINTSQTVKTRAGVATLPRDPADKYVLALFSAGF